MPVVAAGPVPPLAGRKLIIPPDMGAPARVTVPPMDKRPVPGDRWQPQTSAAHSNQRER